MKILISVISIVLILYTLSILGPYFFQEKLLFFPNNTPFGECPNMIQMDAKAFTSSGFRYYLHENIDATNMIFVFHGNAGNACDRSYFLNLLKDVNSSVILFEYPGYGGDSNTPSEKLILDQALAFVRYMRGKISNERSFFLLGESMGTGVATYVASKMNISGLILISAYTSLMDVAQHHYPFIPIKLIMKHPFKASSWAKSSTAPAILFHGELDQTIPIKFAREQVLNFKDKGKLIEIKNGDHNDITAIGNKIIKEEINTFINYTKIN